MRFSTGVLLLIILLASVSPSQTDPLRGRFDPLVEQGLKDDPMPGIAVGIVRQGRLVYARGFGLRVWKDSQKPVTPETLFHMASITKPFVATAVMQLRERGKVDLDAPVTKYVPYFHIDDPRGAKITVRQMLTHSSGMPDVEDYEWKNPQTDDAALERYVRSLSTRKLKLLFDPGTHFSYSNMAYEVLGDLIAKVSGMTFEDYIDANILRPLGMSSSTLLLTKASAALLAQGYTRPRGGDYVSIKQVPAYPFNRAHGPSSDLMSNVIDMSRWAIANLNRGQLDGKRILDEKTYDLMWKPAMEVEFCRGAERADCRKPGGSAGISWFVGDHQGHTAISHSGGDDGFVTYLMLVPDAEMALVLMCNSEHPGISLPQKIVSEFWKVVDESAPAKPGKPLPSA
jgi:CubicO group peptidase (beta-lactamase class C family)